MTVIIMMNKKKELNKEINKNLPTCKHQINNSSKVK